jgi:homogentisate 1,2-dioxygenase
MGFNYTAVDQSVATTRERVAHKECYLGLVAEQIAGTEFVNARETAVTRIL